MRRLKGFSLLELMVTLALSALVIYGLVRVYFDVKATQVRLEAISTIASTGRFVVSYLNDAVVKADFVSAFVKAGRDVLVLHDNNTTRRFYVKYAGRRDKQGDKIYSLYEKRGDKRAVSLTDDVNALHVVLGVEAPDHQSISAYITPKAWHNQTIGAIYYQIVLDSHLGVEKTWQSYVKVG